MAETLRWWVNQWNDLKADGFAAKYTTPFLLQLAMSEEIGGDSDRHFMTLKVGRTSHTKADPLELPVYQVVKNSTNAFGMMITVGRAGNNDVVVETGSVSKFHAYFEQRDGDWRVRDANSSNGTFVGSEQVATDVSTGVPSNSVIKFSRVSFRFMLGADFNALLGKEAARLIRRGEL